MDPFGAPHDNLPGEEKSFSFKVHNKTSISKI